MRQVKCTLAELSGLISKDLNKLQREVKTAIRETARDAVPVIRKNAPKAFGELRESIHAEGTENGAKTIVDAPHASAVEMGSRPHLVPLDALIRWVKLRGMQGLNSKGKLNRGLLRANGHRIGSTTAVHAISVAAELKSMEKNGVLSVGAPEQIARRIQQKILKSGTKPHWYVLSVLPQIEDLLGKNISAAIQAHS